MKSIDQVVIEEILTGKECRRLIPGWPNCKEYTVGDLNALADEGLFWAASLLDSLSFEAIDRGRGE